MGLKKDIFEDLKAHGYSRQSTLRSIKAWITHPSIRLLINYRIGKKIKGSNPLSALIKRSLWLNIVSRTSCHISYQSIIEPGVIFPHATGIVIGNGAHLKSGSKIFQNVTFAIKNDDENKSATAHKGSIIYAGAVLIGNIIIEENAIIGANAVVKQNVPANKMAVGVPAEIK